MEMPQDHDRIGQRLRFSHTHCYDRVDFSGNKYTVHIVFHRSTLTDHHCNMISPLHNTLMCIPTWGRTLCHPNMLFLHIQCLAFQHPLIVRHHLPMLSLPNHFDQLMQLNDLITHLSRRRKNKQRKLETLAVTHLWDFNITQTNTLPVNGSSSQWIQFKP